MLALLLMAGATMLSPAERLPAPDPPQVVVRTPLVAVIPEDEYRKAMKNLKVELEKGRKLF